MVDNLISNNPGKKIEVLDSLRAFAALSVCLYHFVCATVDYIETKWILETFYVGKFGVQLFFVISGFIIPWSMYIGGYKIKSFFTFFLKRLSRLEPPYVVSVILALLLLYFRELYFGKTNAHIDVSANQVSLHFFYLIPFFKGYQWLNSVYWTLAVEFQYYLFIAVLFIPFIKAKTILRYFIYAGIIALSFLSTGVFLLYWLPVFLLGMVLFLFKAGLIKSREYWVVTCLVIAFCVFKYPIPAVVYSVIPLVFVLYWPTVKIKGLHFMGKFSYSIYLLHSLVGATFINILSHAFKSPVEKFMVIVGGTLLTIACSYCAYLVIERPSKRLSASFQYKNSKSR